MLTGTSDVLVATMWTRPGGADASRAAVMTAPGASAPRLPPSPNGLRTTTMRVPSSNTASTFTSRDDVGHTRQHIVDRQHRGPGGRRLHQPRPVARGLADGVGDQRGRLRHVEPQPTCPARPGQFGGREDEQPIPIGRRQAHDRTLFGRTRAPVVTATPRAIVRGLTGSRSR